MQRPSGAMSAIGEVKLLLDDTLAAAVPLVPDGVVHGWVAGTRAFPGGNEAERETHRRGESDNQPPVPGCEPRPSSHLERSLVGCHSVTFTSSMPRQVLLQTGRNAFLIAGGGPNGMGSLSLKGVTVKTV